MTIHRMAARLEGEAAGLPLMPVILKRALERRSGLSRLPVGLVFGLSTDAASSSVKDLLL